MGIGLRRIKRLLAFLRTAWSIVGVTLVVLGLTEAGFRLLFALKDRLSSEPRPDRRVLMEGYGGATWPVWHYQEIESIQEALGALCVLSPEALSRPDHHDR